MEVGRRTRLASGDESAQAVGLAHVVVGTHFEAYDGVDLARLAVT